MMTEEYYKEINIDSITPDLFPDVAVYLKTGANYMLYKPYGRKLTVDDYERLLRRNSSSVFVRTGDMEVVSVYQEQYLADLLRRNDLKSLVKGKILFQICADYVVEIFDSPHKLNHIGRCRNLVRQITWFVTHDKQAMLGAKSLAASNSYQVFHSVQVAALTLLVYTRLFPTDPGEKREDLGIGALLLDLGMSLGDNFHINSSASLSHHEYQTMRQHATLGYEYLSRTGLFSDLSLAVLHHHHERFDGKGYPSHLCGDAIPKGVQIAALCDAFCAMTTDRAYRKAVTSGQALQAMRDAKGAYETVLFQSFEQIVRELPW